MSGYYPGLGFKSAALLICIFCLVYSRTHAKDLRTQRKIYLFCVFDLLTTSLFSIGCGISESYVSDASNYGIWYIFEFGYYLSHNMLGFVFMVYLSEVVGKWFVLSRKSKILLFLPTIFAEALIISTPFTGLAFYADHYQYARGPWLPVLYLISIGYMLYGLFMFIRHRKALIKSHVHEILVLYLITIAGILVQGVFSIFLELIMESFMFLGLLMTVENDNNRFDPVSELYSISAFQVDNRRFIETGHPYTIISMRIANLGMYHRLLDYQSSCELIRKIASSVQEIAEGAPVYRAETDRIQIAHWGTDQKKINARIEKIRTAFEQGWQIGDRLIQPTLVVDCFRVPEDCASVEDVIQRVGSENHAVNGRFTLIPNESYHGQKRRTLIERAIRHALDTNSFRVCFQPIINVKTGKVEAAEALVRMSDPELGPVKPDEFIPIAEQNGTVVDIDAFVFEEVCRLIRDEHLEERGIRYIEVNLSPVQLLYQNLASQFHDILEKYGVRADQINLEITETAAPEEEVAIMEVRKQLYDMGFSFSLDDFGTGYNSIARLLQNPIRNVKIEKGILWDRNARDMLVSMIQVVRSMDMNIVQEGVETEEQLAFVTKAGANLIQGFYYSRPVPAKEFIAFVERFNQKKQEVV